FGENTFFFAQTQSSKPRFAADKAHDLFHQLDRFITAVRDAEPQAQIGKAHYPETDRACSFDDIVDLGKRKIPGIDDVIEELRAKLSDTRKPLPIYVVSPVDLAIGFSEKLGHVDRTKITGIVEMQLLLAARITSVDRAHRGHHVVVPIDLIDKDDPRLGILVG